MNQKLFFAIWFSIALANGNAHAAKDTLNLSDAYRAAVDYDAKIAAAVSANESDREQRGLARAQLLPNVNLNANGGASRSSTDYKVDSQSGPQDKTTPFYTAYTYGVTLRQMIYRKNYIDGYIQSGYAVQQGEVRYELAVQDLTLRVTQAYFDVLNALNNVELSDIELQATAKQLERAKKALDVGTATITEVYDAQARYDLTQSRAIAAKNQLDSAQQSLARIVGFTPTRYSRLQQELPLLLPEPNNVDKWKEVAATNNLQVRLAQLSVDIARLEIERQKGLAYPSLDLAASYSNTYSGDSTFGGENVSTSTRVSLEFSMPLYAGGALSIKTRQLGADRTKAQHLLDDALREADLQTQLAFNSITNSVEQVKALKQGEKSSQSSLDATQKGFELGLRTMIDVLNAQQQLYTSKRDLASAKYQYLMSRLKLKASVGQLAAEDVDGINNWLTN